MTMNINAAPDVIKASTINITPGYMSGFGNSFETEALPGALPRGAVNGEPDSCSA
jgi:homogentisate 1,2-dioxygenase